MLANIEIPLTVDQISNRLGFSSGLIERIVARNGFEPPQKNIIRKLDLIKSANCLNKLGCPKPRSPSRVAMKTNHILAEVIKKSLDVRQKRSGT